ncbi:MAG: hypothetical protein JXA64_01860 [Candidatus Fermentibacteraceae bacterium]|nr:hypothetical protein [Candidatus Fermentibacteraceae bacterium]
MNKSMLPLLLLALSGAALSVPSSLTFYSLSISMQGDTLVKVLELRGFQGSDRLLGRIAVGFEPGNQSIVLDSAEYGTSPGDLHPVPPWAVDTLSGGALWRRSLVTAFPALSEGMEVHYRVTVRDWSGNWSMGPWGVLSPDFKGIRPDSCVFRIEHDLMEGLGWSGEGYRVSSHGGWALFEASDSSGSLAISPFEDHVRLADFLLQEARSVLSSPFPPDLREAALQATSAGADGHAQTMRARTLLCNSMAPGAVLGGEDLGRVRDLQLILDSREATPLEMAVLYAAVCSELDLEAVIVPAGGDLDGVPVPQGWDRFLVRVSSEDGDHWYVEPSAYLTGASWVFRPDTLNIILSGEPLSLPPNTPGESTCRETWRIDPEEGSFVLTIETSGWYDRALRRMTAGIPGEQLLLELAEWSWLSGRTAVPQSVTLSDPYSLDSRMEFSVTGNLWQAMDGGRFAEVLPALCWARPDSVPGELERLWILTGGTEATAGAEVRAGREGGSFTLLDASGGSGPLPVLLQVPE